MNMLQGFAACSLMSVQSVSQTRFFSAYSAEVEVNCAYIQGQSSSVLFSLYCKANILKFSSFSFYRSLSILWSFCEDSFMHHIVLRPSFLDEPFIHALLCSSLGLILLLGNVQRIQNI